MAINPLVSSSPEVADIEVNDISMVPVARLIERFAPEDVCPEVPAD